MYVIVRETDGVTWGFGWEHFTSPACAYPLSDHVSLVRIETSSSRRESLEAWPTTPVSQRVIREYRGRVFNTMSATVRPRADGVDYAVELSIPKVPSSEIHGIDGVWTEAAATRRRGDWKTGGWRPGISEPVLVGSIEVFALPGPEFFPRAIVLLDHATQTPRTLTWTRDCGARYPSGPPVDALLAVSRKPALDRIAELTRVSEAQIAKYRAEGASEALLAGGERPSPSAFEARNIASTFDRWQAGALLTPSSTRC